MFVRIEDHYFRLRAVLFLSASLSLSLILVYQHGVWSALNICAVIVLLFSE